MNVAILIVDILVFSAVLVNTTINFINFRNDRKNG
jgi:hypothetical protein